MRPQEDHRRARRRRWRSPARAACPRRRASRSNRSKSPPRRPRPAATRTCETTFELEEPGATARRPRTSPCSCPEGVFGNPNAVTKCSADDFALEQCPTDSQVGVGDRPRQLRRRRKVPARHGPGLRHGVALRRRDRPLRLHRPGRQHPDQHPDPGADGERLRPDDDRHRDQPGRSRSRTADITIWGFPADGDHDDERFLQGSPGEPAGCPGEGSGLCASNHGSNPHQSAPPGLRR